MSVPDMPVPRNTDEGAGPRYVLSVDGYDFAVARDVRSQDALWVLIEQRTGIQRIGAQNILDTGLMIVADGLVVVREENLP